MKKPPSKNFKSNHHTPPSTSTATPPADLPLAPRTALSSYRLVFSDPSTTFLPRVLRNMPWRDIIFTDAGIVYPATWDMSADGLPCTDSVRHSRAIAHARCISEEERVLLDFLAGVEYPATSDMKKDTRDASSPLDKHNFHSPPFADFADDGDSTSEASSLATTYGIFSRHDAAPASSVLRTDERAATSPCSILCTERKQGPLPRSSSSSCSERQCSSPVAIVNRACSCSCEDDSSSLSEDDTLTASACSDEDLEAEPDTLWAPGPRGLEVVAGAGAGRQRVVL